MKTVEITLRFDVYDSVSETEIQEAVQIEGLNLSSRKAVSVRHVCSSGKLDIDFRRRIYKVLAKVPKDGHWKGGAVSLVCGHAATITGKEHKAIVMEKGMHLVLCQSCIAEFMKYNATIGLKAIMDAQARQEAN